MNLVIHPTCQISEADLISITKNFNASGQMLADGKRNKIKIFNYLGNKINVKAFKVPILINKIIYGYFRPSKAKRSFEYASILLKKGIGTPNPIAYIENKNIIGLQDSYYFCEHIDADLTYRELVLQPEWPNHAEILKQFVGFCFQLHENGIEFKDHSPGNTLIKQVDENKYDFYLVDLNRMSFHETMSFELRMKNLSRLTHKQEMVAAMSKEYAKLYTEKTEQEIFDLMWKETSSFQTKYHKKQAFKKKYLNK
ncbi:Kdo domain containing protein [Flavobacterium agricola]|uniref:Kdo domain containing protein n=1 Tax=Flavobacterium agricola TaxID=2870839 RepID=A0ABY6LXS4_9FLAO|nr:lipopolysaccharide kinase InaA family protein [Flavobacterium agricola]UYW00342.1 Kdo domain containing protein [Flavobacterium agricola]